MHIDDFKKVERLVDDRSRLVESKRAFLKMFENGIERTGNPTPMLVGSEYSLQDSCQITVRVLMNQYAVDIIAISMDEQIGQLDLKLGELGIYTYERETET